MQLETGSRLTVLITELLRRPASQPYSNSQRSSGHLVSSHQMQWHSTPEERLRGWRLSTCDDDANQDAMQARTPGGTGPHNKPAKGELLAKQRCLSQSPAFITVTTNTPASSPIRMMKTVATTVGTRLSPRIKLHLVIL